MLFGRRGFNENDLVGEMVPRKTRDKRRETREVMFVGFFQVSGLYSLVFFSMPISSSCTVWWSGSLPMVRV